MTLSHKRAAASFATVLLVMAFLSSCKGNNNSRSKIYEPRLTKHVEVDVKQLIAQLGSSSYLDRQRAFEAITVIGKEALPEVEANLDNPDPEICHSCERLLRYLRLGLTLRVEEEISSLLSKNPDYDAVLTKVYELGEPGVYVLAEMMADNSLSQPTRLLAFRIAAR